MNILIIYNSLYGNTEQVAQAISNVLRSQYHVELLRVSDVKPDQLAGLNLLIVGSPTQRFRPTKAMSNLLEGIPENGLKGANVAAFDTRLSTSDIESSVGRFFVKAGGYAAKPIADSLKKSGGSLIIPPEGFYVKGTEGPLKEGELERAADWAKQILATL